MGEAGFVYQRKQSFQFLMGDRHGLLIAPLGSQAAPGFNQNQIKEVVLDPVLVILGICGETTAVLIA